MFNDLFSKNADESFIDTAQSFIEELKIKISPAEVEEALLRNPDYPTLACLTDLFNQYQVNNIAMQTSVENLSAMQFPALLHMTSNGGEFLMVRSVDKNEVTFRVNNKWIKEPLHKFTERWSGTILMAEASEASGDPDFKRKKRREQFSSLRLPLLVSIPALITLVGAIRSDSWLVSLVLVLLFLGSLVTTVLIVVEADSSGKLAQKFCKVKPTLDCKSVLSSPAAKLFGVIPMTSIGFVYFMGSYISLFIGIITGVLPLRELSLITMVALPYTFFSLYYQYNVVKKWCTLCVAVQALIMSLAVTLVLATAPMPLILPNEGILLILLISFSLPVVFVLIHHETSQRYEKNKLELERNILTWRRDPAMFRFLLYQGLPQRIEKFDNEIILGSPEAPLTAVVVINPHCSACRQTIKQMVDVLNRLDDKINFYLRFQLGHDVQDPFTLVNQLVRLNKEGGEPLKNVLKDYLHLSTSQFSKKYRTTKAHELEEVIQEHAAWCQTINIEDIPAVYIDGYSLPDRYFIQDLPYVLQEPVMH